MSFYPHYPKHSIHYVIISLFLLLRVLPFFSSYYEDSFTCVSYVIGPFDSVFGYSSALSRSKVDQSFQGMR